MLTYTGVGVECVLVECFELDAANLHVAQVVLGVGSKTLRGARVAAARRFVGVHTEPFCC